MKLIMLSVARLTSQLVRLNITKTVQRPAVQAVLSSTTTTTTRPSPLSSSNNHYLDIQTRTLAQGSRKKIEKKNAKRLKLQAKKKKHVGKPSGSIEEVAAEKEEQPFLQMQEWVKFQKSIAVDGFQTGQVTTARVIKKSKGGKQMRRKREREMAAQRQDDLKLEKFPAIRYSEEETKRLLEEAYSMIPERAGKRGTRNLKRQKRRWFLVRKIRAKYKAFRKLEHERRMHKRHLKRQAVLAVKEEAPAIREEDLSYQEQVLRRWAAAMVEDSGNPSANEAIANV